MNGKASAEHSFPVFTPSPPPGVMPGHLRRTLMRTGSISGLESNDAISRQDAMNRFKGLSLIELLTALSIATILFSIVVPTLSSILHRSALQSSSQQLVNGIALTRLLAIQRRQAITMVNLDGAWNNGWNIFIDSNGNGLPGEDEPSIRTQGPLDRGVHVVTNQPLGLYIRFLPDGRAYLRSGGFQVGTIWVCHQSTDISAVKLTLNIGGRLRQSASGCQI